MNMRWFQNGGLNYLNLKSNSNKIHIMKHKSQSNGKRPFYYFHSDSYTRIIYKYLLHKKKRKEIQNWIDLLQTKIQNKSNLNSYLHLIFNLALLIFSNPQNKHQRQKKILLRLKCRLCQRHNQIYLGSILELRN